MATEPYRDTTVTTSRSKEQIGKVLREAGARGLQLEEEWDAQGNVESCLIRFMYPTEKGAMMRVRFAAKPLPPERGARGGWKIDAAQRERQAWRGLAWYIESLTKAAAFGFVRFEEVFLAYFEDDTGRTIGEALIPELELGRLALPRGTT